MTRLWSRTGSFATTCTRNVRRLGDRRRDTISLRRCLDVLIKIPTLVTRSGYEHLASVAMKARGTDDEVLRERVFAGYDDFAGGSSNQLDRRQLNGDLDRLDEAATLVHAYTNERIAHRSHEADLSELTFGDLDRAINAAGELAHKYYRLSHPGQSFWWITPTVEPRWLATFQHPGWTPDFQPIRPEDLG
jgi:hypothetical protein